MPDWLKSDYEWVWKGEILRFVLISGISTGALLANQWLGAVQSGSELSDGWWIGPVTGFALGVVAWVQGKLPTRETPPTP